MYFWTGLQFNMEAVFCQTKFQLPIFSNFFHVALKKLFWFMISVKIRLNVFDNLTSRENGNNLKISLNMQGNHKKKTIMKSYLLSWVRYVLLFWWSILTEEKRHISFSSTVTPQFRVCVTRALLQRFYILLTSKGNQVSQVLIHKWYRVPNWTQSPASPNIWTWPNYWTPPKLCQSGQTFQTSDKCNDILTLWSHCGN